MWFTDTMTDLETMPVERVDVDTDEYGMYKAFNDGLRDTPND